jgi:hypothetical protein
MIDVRVGAIVNGAKGPIANAFVVIKLLHDGLIVGPNVSDGPGIPGRQSDRPMDNTVPQVSSIVTLTNFSMLTVSTKDTLEEGIFHAGDFYLL